MVCIHVHNNISQNSQKVDIAKIFMDGWLNKLWCICTVKYFSAIKENEVLIYDMSYMYMSYVYQNEVLIYSHHGWLLKHAKLKKPDTVVTYSVFPFL